MPRPERATGSSDALGSSPSSFSTAARSLCLYASVRDLKTVSRPPPAQARRMPRPERATGSSDALGSSPSSFSTAAGSLCLCASVRDLETVSRTLPAEAQRCHSPHESLKTPFLDLLSGSSRLWRLGPTALGNHPRSLRLVMGSDFRMAPEAGGRTGRGSGRLPGLTVGRAVVLTPDWV
jgi:hypothetical protein